MRSKWPWRCVNSDQLWPWFLSGASSQWLEPRHKYIYDITRMFMTLCWRSSPLTLYCLHSRYCQKSIRQRRRPKLNFRLRIWCVYFWCKEPLSFWVILNLCSKFQVSIIRAAVQRRVSNDLQTPCLNYDTANMHRIYRTMPHKCFPQQRGLTSQKKNKKKSSFYLNSYHHLWRCSKLTLILEAC